MANELVGRFHPTTAQRISSMSRTACTAWRNRRLSVGGTAVFGAAEKVAAKARAIAAHLLEASEDDLEFRGGVFSVAGTSGPSVTIQEVAGAA